MPASRGLNPPPVSKETLDMQALRMPRALDEQMYVLFWSADELLPGLFIFIMGVLINQKLLCLLVAIVVTKLFRKLKEGNPDGFLLHLGYWYGLISGKKAYSMPNAFIREFIP
jgi:conjugal transfer pilus assembly protein TraL